ncbi:Rieske 2Fe-2S domain-containing protein [Jatrophihabitans cynanchi]|uniref:Rieske 2Fe-2S domain-containing protein n=1 Tax=Jatrophihabitans cynanchi TaxID=2944128 RepID=A0ABY7K1S2_9ACTN|nr:Rieske 2Fe-2S domain-containing protein [Jatrophihabitans sp. SB3-54]WAX58458.1 Rieske 2Fe-2S domain-containing protein [Jatrophihabitans sp. SB3-54]
MSELRRRGRVVVELSEPRVEVLVVHSAGWVFAVQNRCPHRGISLAGGELRGRSITCSAHQWRFDLGSGHCLSAVRTRPQALITVDTWVQDDRVWLTVPAQQLDSLRKGG